MAKITHPNTGVGVKRGIPKGSGSASYSATTVGPPVDQPRKAVTPRTDKAGPACRDQGMFHRGAKRVWNKVRPRASAKYKA